MVFSIDGHFGLCRKQKAGKSVRPPLNEGRLFEPQSAVDEFVRGYPTVKTSGNKVHWNPSKADTIGTWAFVLYREVSLTQGLGQNNCGQEKWPLLHK